ncbi:hypothetical protein JTB14_023025 [Gonioctena quinquepunctata]|nr:hypothetical protein JTB14_023025 [Gonioctena quinquepunctata]
MTTLSENVRTPTPSMFTVQNMTSFSSPYILSINAKEHVASTSTARSPFGSTPNVFLSELLTVQIMISPSSPSILSNNAKEPNLERRVLSEKENKPKKIKKTNKKSRVNDEEDEAEIIAFARVALRSLPREKWVQCLECKGWSHEARTGGELQYVCHN